MHQVVYLADKEIRYHYLYLFGQVAVIFSMVNSILFEDVSPVRLSVLLVCLVFFSVLAMYTIKKLLAMAKDVSHSALT